MKKKELDGKEEVNVEELKKKEWLDRIEPVVSDDFIEEHKGFIEAIAGKVSRRGRLPTGIDFSDLVSWGVEGLIFAKKNFKPAPNTQFKTYAFYRVRGTIMDHVRKEWQYRDPSGFYEYRKTVRERIATVVEDELERSSSQDSEVVMKHILDRSMMVGFLSSDVLEIESSEVGGGDPESNYIKKEDSTYQDLIGELEELDKDEKDVLTLLYVHHMKQIDVSLSMKLSQSKVSRIHARGLDKLRRRFLRRLTPK